MGKKHRPRQRVDIRFDNRKVRVFIIMDRNRHTHAKNSITSNRIIRRDKTTA
jgi:hypothetical protein